MFAAQWTGKFEEIARRDYVASVRFRVMRLESPQIGGGLERTAT